MWILRLHDMRSPKIEMYEVVARCASNEKLEQWVQLERVERYRDGEWEKTFRKGGPLEWYNEPYGQFSQGIFNICSEEECVEDARQRYREFLNSTYLVE